MTQQPNTITTSSRVRTEPVQQRSSDRVTLLMDAAAALIDEKGIDGLTTSDVAARSESSVGVVYRYFPNIQSLLRALAARNLERFIARSYPVETITEGDWLERLDDPFNAYIEMSRSEPGFRALRFGTVIDERFVGGSENANDQLVSALIDVMHQRHAGIKPTADLLLDLEVAVETATALMQRAFSEDSQGDPRFIEKARRITQQLLSSYRSEIEGS